jgi:hypothetical protein
MQDLTNDSRRNLGVLASPQHFNTAAKTRRQLSSDFVSTVDYTLRPAVSGLHNTGVEDEQSGTYFTGIRRY